MKTINLLILFAAILFSNTIFSQIDCTNDVNPPIALCKAGINVQVEAGGNVTLFATDFDEGSFDDCSAVTFSFAELSEVGSIIIDENTVSPMIVSLYVKDAAGNQNTCWAELFINNQTSISGNISTELGDGISGVSVSATLAGTNQVIAQTTTTQSGDYVLSDLDNNATYVIAVAKNGDDSNGVSTFDVVMVTRHIVGSTALPTPFRIIAADVNMSGTISTFDMVYMKRLILRISDSFLENVPSWRFFRSTIQFSDPNNPFVNVTGNSFTINLAENAGVPVNFIGVKLGDVNNSAIPH